MKNIFLSLLAGRLLGEQQYYPITLRGLPAKPPLLFVYNLVMSNYPSYSRKTYFGVAALFTGVISVLFSGASYSIVYLNISQELFNFLNNITALVFCSLTPITILLGIVGLTRKKDSRSASIIAIVLVLIPTFIVVASLMSSFRR